MHHEQSGFRSTITNNPYSSAEYIGYGLRVTARVTFVCFLLAYVARPAVQVFGIGKWLIRHRRYLGLSAAISHTVHFYFVMAFSRITEEPVALITWIVGGAAFAFFWIMAITSNSSSMRKLGVWWRRLHWVGMQHIWLILTATFLGSALSTGTWHWLFPLTLLAAMALRIVAFVQKRKN